MVWFLEAGWEVFTPVVDMNATDLVVRSPRSLELTAVQIKHKERGSKNEGQIQRVWDNDYVPFDMLVFYQPEKRRGVIAPRRMLIKPGSLFQFFKKDSEGYSTGAVRPMFADYFFEIPSPRDEPSSALYFTGRFQQVVEAEKKKTTQARDASAPSGHGSS